MTIILILQEGSLWNFKRDEITDNANVTNDNNAPSFKYESNLIGNTEGNETKKNCKNSCTIKIFK